MTDQESSNQFDAPAGQPPVPAAELSPVQPHAAGGVEGQPGTQPAGAAAEVPAAEVPQTGAPAAVEGLPQPSAFQMAGGMLPAVHAALAARAKRQGATHPLSSRQGLRDSAINRLRAQRTRQTPGSQNPAS